MPTKAEATTSGQPTKGDFSLMTCTEEAITREARSSAEDEEAKANRRFEAWVRKNTKGNKDE